MGANKGSNDSVRFFKLIAKADKANIEEKKAIVEVVKNNKGEYIHGEWFGSISGFITSMSVKSFEFEGVPKEKFIMVVEDSDDACQIEFTNSIAAQGIINSMLNADLTRKVEIGAYINKSGYVGTSIRYSGDSENIKWKIEPKDLPKPVPYKSPGGKEMTDNTNVLSFWRNSFLEISKRAVKENFKGGKKAKEPVIKEPPPASSLIQEDDSLPF